MPNYLIHIAALIIIITKLADVWTTLKFLKRGSVSMERNSFARKLMLRFGYEKVVWGVFVITLIIVGISDWVTILNNSLLYDITFVTIALFISVVQASVALFNYSGRDNAIVRLISEFSFYK